MWGPRARDQPPGAAHPGQGYSLSGAGVPSSAHWACDSPAPRRAPSRGLPKACHVRVPRAQLVLFAALLTCLQK